MSILFSIIAVRLHRLYKQSKININISFYLEFKSNIFIEERHSDVLMSNFPFCESQNQSIEYESEQQTAVQGKITSLKRRLMNNTIVYGEKIAVLHSITYEIIE